MLKYLKLKTAALGVFIAITGASVAQETEVEFIDSFGDWILLETRNETGGFDACWLIRDYDGGDVLEFYLTSELSAISFSNEAWAFQEGDTYAVEYHFDNGQPNASEIFAIEAGSSVYLDVPLEDLSSKLKRATTFYVEGEFITLAFDLADSSAAIIAAEDCLARNTGMERSNPFAGGSRDDQPDPIADGSSASSAPEFFAKTAWETEPLVSFDDYDQLFDELRSFDISATIQYSEFPIGRYMAEIEDLVQAFYWEEDSSTRLSTVVYADVLTEITGDCLDTAGGIIVDEESEVVHQVRGQIGCQLDDSELYIRLTVLDLSTLAVVMVFMADPEEVDFIDAIEDVVVTGLVQALEAE